MWMLRDGEKTVSELAKELDIPIANISQHLRIMRDQGAVVTKREGRTIFYMISNKKFLKGAQLIREGIMEVIEKKGLLMSMPARSPKRTIKS
jgi:ArsR family transcriptional regulator